MNKNGQMSPIKVVGTSVWEATSGTAPVSPKGPIPQEKPHLTVELRGDEGTKYYAQMSIEVAKHLVAQMGSLLEKQP